ncbi:MAG: SH3 domain-containing protein, partial [Anaerolineae bacterium]|nr:SH3 domain-containing protein [Anaerolineae bacterium]
AQIESCPDALASQLYPGVFARVSSANNLLPLNLRADPRLNANIVRKIAPDQTFQVLAGPACADGFAWFEVAYGLTVRRGWVAEGEKTAQGADYFAEPIPGR